MSLEALESEAPVGRDLVQLLGELQGLKVAVVAGALPDVNIAIAGIAVVDTILTVLHFNIAAGNVTDVSDRTAETAITSAGNIQLADTDTTGDKLVVAWYDKPAL